MSDKSSQHKEGKGAGACDLFHLPERLFKYYRYDNNLNESRLTGDVYLASPLDFNDPCDCQRSLHNNAREMDEERRRDNPEEAWLETKLQELGYDAGEVEKLADSLRKDDEDLSKVYRKQLEKAGILCVTQQPDSPLMWGYYTDNNGFCIEYDNREFVKRLVVGFVNVLDYRLTEFLYEKKTYKNEPSERCRNARVAALIPVASAMLSDCVGKIRNAYLVERGDDAGVKNFLVNIMLKRFVGKTIEYSGEEKLCAYQPTLFFEEGNQGSHNKYFVKTKPWEHEKEFRVVVSLGGRKVVNLGKDIIKAVYLGCNTPKENIVQIAYLLATNEIDCSLYMMKRNDSCMLEPKRIEFSSAQEAFKVLDGTLDKIMNDEL